MKEWKKPLVKVVIVEEDVIATSENVTPEKQPVGANTSTIGYDDTYKNMW